MPPPQLPTDGPVSFFAEPVEIPLGITVWEDLDTLIRDGIHGGLCKIGHLDEPLIREKRFDGSLGSIRVRKFDFSFLDFFEQPELFKVFDHSPPCLLDGEFFIGARR